MELVAVAVDVVVVLLLDWAETAFVQAVAPKFPTSGECSATKSNAPTVGLL